MSNTYFRFKQFTVHHDRCSMKVGTDGVLLGAWAELPQMGNVLDIGTGTGLLALMAAQRRPGVHVIGLDIDSDSVAQALENVKESTFADRIDILEQDVLNYDNDTKFDAILCNPPFYTEDTLPPDHQRAVARNASQLPFPELIEKVSKLLMSDGKFSVVLPSAAMQGFVALCLNNGLYLSRKLAIKTTERKEPKRVLLTFTLSICNKTVCDELVLMKDGVRSREYSRLTAEFYL